MKKDMPGQKKMKPEIRTFVVIWRKLKFYQTFKRGHKHGQIQFSEEYVISDVGQDWKEGVLPN